MNRAEDNPHSEALWKKQCPTYADWSRFMNHGYDDPSRQLAYDMIREYVNGKPPCSFLEIGFGDCYDFAQCFMHLHDQGRIQYTGYDITAEFVRFAQRSFPGYWFLAAGFAQLHPSSYDIIYTRGTLEHVAPTLWEGYLRAMLRATRKLAMQVWFLPPGRSMSRYDDKNGAWLNCYEREEVEAIIGQEGFDHRRHNAEDDCIYVMERRK